MLTGPITSFLQMGNGVGSVGWRASPEAGDGIGVGPLQQMAPPTSPQDPDLLVLLNSHGQTLTPCLSSRACQSSPCGVEVPFQVPIHRADPPTPDSLPLKPNPLWEAEFSQTCFQSLFTTSCLGALGESLKLCFLSSKAGPTDSRGQALALDVPRGPTERGQTFVLAWLRHHLHAHLHLSFLQDSAPQENPTGCQPRAPGPSVQGSPGAGVSWHICQGD